MRFWCENEKKKLWRHFYELLALCVQTLYHKAKRQPGQVQKVIDELHGLDLELNVSVAVYVQDDCFHLQ